MAVGKFGSYRPSMLEIRKFFSSLNLLGKFSLGLYDQKHILIHFSDERDLIRVRLRGSYFVNKNPLRIWKWEVGFRPGHESSLIPVWLSFPELPVEFWDSLKSLASIFGHPIQVDKSTLNFSRPSVARILVEFDAKRQFPEEIYISVNGKNGFTQKVFIENRPHYCDHCFKLGHSISNCFFKFPNLRNPPRPIQIGPEKTSFNQSQAQASQATQTPFSPKNPIPPPCLLPIHSRGELDQGEAHALQAHLEVHPPPLKPVFGPSLAHLNSTPHTQIPQSQTLLAQPVTQPTHAGSGLFEAHPPTTSLAQAEAPSNTFKAQDFLGSSPTLKSPPSPPPPPPPPPLPPPYLNPDVHQPCVLLQAPLVSSPSPPSPNSTSPSPSPQIQVVDPTSTSLAPTLSTLNSRHISFFD
ncbi:hypothetical protein AXF42_Ash019270 [Apostasia shenzhenica]|uniref:DUF4283 domain-containing protein n=1 Tax=Apostasia shenzhenica TaxID=1088818 RepID=A0A2I0AR68_9ASPA|nr:hypothetical protein AXF42_Ash019270 [Apostasia shenzhenica]